MTRVLHCFRLLLSLARKFLQTKLPQEIGIARCCAGAGGRRSCNDCCNTRPRALGCPYGRRTVRH